MNLFQHWKQRKYGVPWISDFGFNVYRLVFEIATFRGKVSFNSSFSFIKADELISPTLFEVQQQILKFPAL